MDRIVAKATTKLYVMKNDTTGVEIRCTEKYILDWLVRGFHIEKILYK